MKFFFGVFFVSLFTLLPAWGDEQVPVGTRPIGMGEAFVAVADDGNAVHLNPAGISLIQRYTFNGMRADLLGTDLLKSGLSQNYFSAVLPMTPNFAFGVDWLNIGVDDEELGFRQNQFNLALSYNINPMFAVGMNGKYVSEFTGLDGTTIDTASGFGWDAGFLFVPRFLPKVGDRLQVGLMLQDVAGNHTDGILGGTSIRHDFTGLPPVETPGETEIQRDETIFPTHYKVGIAYHLVKKQRRNWLVALDVDDRLHLGSEYSPVPMLAIRGGLQMDLRDTGESPTYSLGGSLKYNQWLAFDLAYELPPTLPANLLISLAGSFDFQRSPIKIKDVKIVEEGIFVVHHVFYAKKEEANVIIIKELVSSGQQETAIAHLDDYATVLSTTPRDKTFEFRRDAESAWEAIEVGKELQKGGTLRIPASSKLRLRMEKTGYTYEYTTAPMNYELEPTDKMGRIWLENRGHKPVDVTVKLSFEEYMETFKEVTDTHEIPPKSIASIALQHLTFLNSPRLLQRRTTGPVDARIAVAATTGEKPHQDVSQTLPDFQLLGINTMVWKTEDDLFKLGSFISPRDKAVESFAKQITAMYRGEDGGIENDALRKVLLLYAALKTYGITYGNDPELSSYGEGTDTISHAREMLKPVEYVDERGNKQKIGVGDCDDSTVLFATLMQALDVEPLLILQPRHVFVAFNTGIPRHVAEQISVGTLGTEWYYLVNETAWIPMETTYLKADYDFGDAWKEGVKRMKAGIIDAIPVSLAQWKYKPADIYNDDPWTPELPSKAQIDQKLNKEQSLTWLKNLSMQSTEIQKTRSSVPADEQK